MQRDAVTLEELSAAAPPPPRAGCAGAAPPLKALAALFLLFLLVASDAFTGGVLASFGEKAVRGRAPTAWGVVLQGVILVVLFAGATHLASVGVL